MSEITPDSVQTLLNSEDFGDRNRGVNQLRQLDPQVAFKLIQPMIQDQNTRVRYAAVSQLDTLGRQDRQKALKLLRDRLLNDPEPDVQAAAADALGALQLTEAYEDLAKLYHDTSEWLVQVSILAALGEMGDLRSFELLEEGLEAENDLLKTAAIGSLGELGDPRAVPLLANFVDHPDWQTRYRTGQALGNIGGTEARALLEALAKDEVEQVAQMAQSSLEKS